MEEPVRVLFVNSEIFPYMPETDISVLGRYLPQGIQESGKEIRSFMPRYGTINERRNQLHEVIRLSGMNMVINNADRPLVIKVSSIANSFTRTQKAKISKTTTNGPSSSRAAYSKP